MNTASQSAIDQLDKWLGAMEGEHFEFKEAKNRFSFDGLALLPRVRRLVELGVVERIGRGNGTRYLLSRRFYAMSGRKGAYTRRRGLDDETQKELLLRHLRDNPTGSALSELRQVLPQVGEKKVQFLLQELRAEGRAELQGARRWARWFAAKAAAPGSGV